MECGVGVTGCWRSLRLQKEMPITNFMEISHPEGGEGERNKGKRKKKKKRSAKKIPPGFEMRKAPTFIYFFIYLFLSLRLVGAPGLLSSVRGGVGAPEGHCWEMELRYPWIHTHAHA